MGNESSSISLLKPLVFSSLFHKLQPFIKREKSGSTLSALCYVGRTLPERALAAFSFHWCSSEGSLWKNRLTFRCSINRWAERRGGNYNVAHRTVKSTFRCWAVRCSTARYQSAGTWSESRGLVKWDGRRAWKLRGSKRGREPCAGEKVTSQIQQINIPDIGISYLEHVWTPFSGQVQSFFFLRRGIITAFLSVIFRS